MPGIVTHHVFGTDVYRELAPLIGESSDALDAFLLGNLGPDPFFFIAASPMLQKFKRLGQMMHRKNTPELLFALHGSLVAPSSEEGGEGDEGDPCKAYALGFVCHYLLDSTIHPLVYAQQHAICNVGIEGLSGVWAHRVVHATIETTLDEYLLTTRLGATAATLAPHKTMLKCPQQELVRISCAFSEALCKAYELDVPNSIFVSAVDLNRLGQRTLDSKSAGLRSRFDYLAGPGMASKYVEALSLRAQLRPEAPYTNDDHAAWEVPFSQGAVIDESFCELYGQALQAALIVLPAFARKGFSLDACQALVAGVNFLGRAVERSQPMMSGAADAQRFSAGDGLLRNGGK